MASLSADAAPAAKTYVDAGSGVSFSYPANWTLNGDDDAATAKLRVALSSQADAVVTLEGSFADRGTYKGSDFEAGAFSYVVSEGGTEEECYAALDRSTEAAQKAAPTVWNGLKARRLDTRYSVAGTDDTHHMIAVFRRKNCYLFETVVVSHNPADVEKPLSTARWSELRLDFAGVLGSVRFGQKP